MSDNPRDDFAALVELDYHLGQTHGQTSGWAERARAENPRLYELFQQCLRQGQR